MDLKNIIGNDLKKIIFLFLICSTTFSSAQTAYTFNIVTGIEQCRKATAQLEITGTAPADSVAINWSNGISHTKTLYDLSEGDYSVRIFIKHKADTLVFLKDTTLTFRIDKKDCTISIGKYFSPNGDNYNDVLAIGNVENYPDFELEIFDKWGQRVCHQRSVYMPWDGKWLGVDLPDGAYYFIFFYNAADRHKLEKGDITIIR